MEKFYRLFVAIDFGEEEKEKLYNYGMTVRENSVKGNFTHKENLHLTLAFIGETRRRKEAEEALKDGVIKSRITPFAIETEKLGRFKSRGGDILWVGLKESPELICLHEKITESLRRKDFNIEEQQLKAHLTVGRGVVLNKTAVVEELSAAVPGMRIPVNTIHLMNSLRIDGKLTYSSLYKVSLC
ncbi:RNA 2',3'-cyclic phosphodiesterase [Anaerocolumna xylanovorans]|uniref:RNA 2',3'-cyclic phosphodiesterase n=1 Tax=Anaerocolumna xylanovorans DSM 12503 TaxID=1121345 RepID=A0A1M7YE15_9FIRM|nr:RNA 2',3'-cyclic phosphodiesterase [Anaerocolumna xylanovorans]SHO50819.1 2'-5' RNA ligase [Anaerocolumna xylanovorans DSM 12503]